MVERRKFNSPFKAKVALDAIRGDKTLNELARKYKLHPNQITQWKKRLLEGSCSLFDAAGSKQESAQEIAEQLYQKIGQLQVELDWLKKKSESF